MKPRRWLLLAVAVLALSSSGFASEPPSPFRPNEPEPFAPEPPEPPGAPDLADSAAACNTPIATVLAESQSGIASPQQLVIDNVTDWCALWDKVYALVFPRPSCDSSAIDFSRDVALAVALGDGPNSCYGIGITCIDQHEDHVIAEVTSVMPGPRCACASVIVRPVHVVKMPRPVTTVDWRPRTELRDCP